MKLKTFFQKLDQFAGAPDALAKMRELVLDLAAKGWWRLADTPQAHRAMSLAWFKDEGLLDPEAFYLAARNAC
jgi:hypothetical protein